MCRISALTARIVLDEKDRSVRHNPRQRRRHSDRGGLLDGGWPATLEVLVPEFLAEAPQGPYDVKPLRLEVEGERLVLRSFGQSRPENLPPQNPLGDQLTVVLEKPQRP
jgi:hypothetical protein